ncbi:MAG: hypothetical protein RLZZ272_1151 [Actinomycetota bacterium]
MSATGGRSWCIVSHAPRYGVGGRAERLGMHFTGHQDGLAAAAAELGHRFEILGAPSEDTAASGDPVAAVRRRLAEGGVDLVVVYEGRLEQLAAFAELARDHPGTRVLLNLFKSERHLDTPRSRGSRRADLARLRRRRDDALTGPTGPFTALVPPDNLVLTAETERRALLARSLGLRVVGAWPLHSQLAVAPLPPPTERPDGPPRVLIQLQAHKVEDATMRELARVIGTSGRLAPDRVRWVLAGRVGTERRLVRSVGRLERLGVEVVDGGLSDDAYRALHDASDVVWLPVRGAYNTQSSGKALDALARGLPVLAPAGSYGASEQSRWVPGAPSYGSTEEAIELVLRLPWLLATWRAALHERLPEVRTALHPRSSILGLLGLAGLSVTDGPTDGDGAA